MFRVMLCGLLVCLAIIPSFSWAETGFCNTTGGPKIFNVDASTTVTNPDDNQSCEINAGEVISVDFGTIFASNFTARGHKPDGFVDKKTAIAYICKNISDGVVLTMTFSGAPANGMPEALATNNPDVGVLTKNDSEQVIPVNTGEVSMPLRLTGAIDILTAPVNLSGKSPQNGEFSGSASITVNIR
ncbi:fimbrial protein [Cronobacter malonaticus]